MGEFLSPVVIGAIIAATSYTLTAFFADVPFSLGGLSKATLIGAASGAVTFGLGQGFSSICNFSSTATGFIPGATSGAITGFFNGVTGSIINSVISGGSIKIMQLVTAGLMSAGIGAGIGGIQGGISANKEGMNFWTGNGSATSSADILITETGGNIPVYSNEYAQNFSDSHIELKRLSENIDNLYADGSVPNGYTFSDGKIFDSDGNSILGVKEKSGFYISMYKFW